MAALDTIFKAYDIRGTTPDQLDQVSRRPDGQILPGDLAREAPSVVAVAPRAN